MAGQDPSADSPPGEPHDILSPASAAVSPFTIPSTLHTPTHAADVFDTNHPPAPIDRPASAGSHHATQARVHRPLSQFRSTTVAGEPSRSSIAPPQAAPFEPPGEQTVQDTGGIGRHTRYHGPIVPPRVANARRLQVPAAQPAAPQVTATAAQAPTAPATVPQPGPAAQSAAPQGPTQQPSTGPTTNTEAATPRSLQPASRKTPTTIPASAPTQSTPQDQELEPATDNPNIPPQIPFTRIPPTHYRSFHDPSNPWTSLIRPDYSVLSTPTLNPSTPTYLQDKITFNTELHRYQGIWKGEPHWFYPGGRCYGRSFRGKEEFGFHDPQSGVKECKACERMQIPIEEVLRGIHEQYGGGKDGGGGVGNPAEVVGGGENREP